MIRNTSQISSHYSEIEHIFRPGHADYAFQRKYGIRDPRGGGRSSGRETAARVFGGALAKEILRREGIVIGAGAIEVAGIRATGYGWNPPFPPPLYAPKCPELQDMIKAIEDARADSDSVGGVIECRAQGVPAGLGDPVFDKLDALLAHAMLSIGAVKAIEFGAGFAAARMKGSENNDQMDEKGFITNNAGGILGGITTGEEIIFRASFKPTPSIARVQHTLGTDGIVHELEINGRHDPTVLVRAIPVVEAMSAMTILDLLLEDMKYGG